MSYVGRAGLARSLAFRVNAARFGFVGGAASAAAAGVGLAGYAGYRGYRRFRDRRSMRMRRVNYVPVMGRGAKRPRTEPSERNGTEEAVDGGYDKEDRVYVKTGRKVSKRHIVDVLSRADALSRTLFFKVLPTQFTGVNGQLWLSHNSLDATNDRLPLYLFNLDRLQLAGTGEGAGHRLVYNQTTGFFGWIPITGQSATGTGTVYPQVLRQAADFPVSNQKDLYFSNYSIKLCLYGNTTRTTTFDIYLVSFTEEQVAPANDANTLNGGGSTPDGLEHQTFWQTQVRDIIAHPCAIDVPYGQQSKMRIHKRARYIIGPNSTTQSDTNPGHVIVNWFHQRNKKIGMRRTGIDPGTDAQRLDEIFNAQENRTDLTGQAGLLTETPNAVDRMYLYIRANDYVLNTAGDTNATAASFDIAYTTTYYVNV